MPKRYQWGKQKASIEKTDNTMTKIYQYDRRDKDRQYYDQKIK